MLRKIKKIIDKNIAIIMITSRIAVLALLGIIPVCEYRMMLPVAVALMCFTFLLNVILMIFWR